MYVYQIFFGWDWRTDRGWSCLTHFFLIKKKLTNQIVAQANNKKI